MWQDEEDYDAYELQEDYTVTTKFLQCLNCPEISGPVSLDDKENALKYILFLENAFKNLLLPGLSDVNFRKFVVMIMVSAAAGTDCLKEVLDSEINFDMFKNQRVSGEKIIYTHIFLYALVYNLKVIIAGIDNWEISVNSEIVRVMFSYITQIKNLVDLNLNLQNSIN